MIWQAWAAQGAVLLGLALIAGFATSMATIDDRRLGRIGWPIALAFLTAGATSLIVAGWVAPWGAA